MTFEIRILEAAAVRPLRLAILRPGGKDEDVIWPGDDDPEARHLGAYLDLLLGDPEPGDPEVPEGTLLAVASIRPALHPHDPRPGDWQLRGMATLPALRGHGAGQAVLTACLVHAEGEGGHRVWCNARTSAVGFYERRGFSKVGAEFETPGIGPHVVMELTL
jgi:ribosomal protein S18 acetylase RimI-like enzyme